MPLNILGKPDCCHGTEILTYLYPVVIE
jgi:hypothetical protein